MSNFKKIAAATMALGVIGGTILPATTASAASYKSEVKTKGTLTVGLEGTYSPFSYKTKTGKLKGYDVDVARAVAKQLHMKPKFVLTQFDSLPAGLNAGKFDVIYNDMGVTPTREKSYTFGGQYLYTSAVMIVKKGSKLTDAKDIKGQKLAQSTSSNYGIEAKKLGANIVASAGFAQSLDLVDSGKAVATFNSEDAWGVYKKANPKTDLKAIDASDVLANTGAAPMLAKKNTALAKAITKAQDHLRKDGVLKKISVEYFGSDLSAKK